MTKLAAVCTYGGDDAVRHRMREAEVRRNETVVHGKQTDDRLDAARSTGGMACEALRARHGRQVAAKDTLQGDTLALVVVGRACAVGIHIVNV